VTEASATLTGESYSCEQARRATQRPLSQAASTRPGSRQNGSTQRWHVALRCSSSAPRATVTARGFIDDYSGVRISKTGRRFKIFRATVWNLLNEDSQPCGQAAMFGAWEFL